MPDSLFTMIFYCHSFYNLATFSVLNTYSRHTWSSSAKTCICKCYRDQRND